MTAAHEFSLVIACEGYLPMSNEVPGWLAAARNAVKPVGGELIVVGSGATGPGPVHSQRDRVDETWLSVPGDVLVPTRWALGLRRARGDYVGLSIDACTIPEDWVRCASDALSSGAGAVGGGFKLSPGANRVATAIYHLRYGRFPPGSHGDDADDLAGDNVAYRRELLDACFKDWANGFWEVVVHQRLRGQGVALTLLSGLDVGFATGMAFREAAWARFRHGRHSGDWRVRSGRRRRWQIVLAAPFVPAVLLWRAARRAHSMDGGTRGLARASLHFLALAAAWSAGEVAGVLRRQD